MSDSTLIKAQKAVIRSIVPNKSSLPILGTVKRTGSTIEVTDLDTGARVHHMGATPNGFEPVLIAKRQALDTLDKPYTVGDGKVNIDDLFAVLGAWGICEGCCPADLDVDGAVNIDDIFEVLSAWGPCP